MVLCLLSRLVKGVVGTPLKRMEQQVNRITSDVLFPLQNTNPVRGDKQYADLHHHSWYGEMVEANKKIDEILIKKKQNNSETC
ncbi:hypothetical protein C9374_005769 [Naegleria lovaniensis]|uniref:Uncharacterized protein n=1 Tax=Naegleria lovaniensis TaxID=51637 RepID=A0AA88KI99_NAELO|nr:uncharacterized protein C9374_005769 [Naegleria lovaniensis]KAG2381977.1 hypothetical protein C9374_005769 [Naegleria lovaniensis]